jgi:hypothetical protein
VSRLGSKPHYLEELMGTSHPRFAEVPTAVFARVRARNREAGIDAASVQSLLAAARQEVEDAARELGAAIGRLLGEPGSAHDRRRERRRRRQERREEGRE